MCLLPNTDCQDAVLDTVPTVIAIKLALSQMCILSGSCCQCMQAANIGLLMAALLKV